MAMKNNQACKAWLAYIFYYDVAVRSLGIPIGGLDWRDDIIEKPCIVGAQPTGKYAN